MYREALALSGKKPKASENEIPIKGRAKRVRTLVRAGETGRALRAAFDDSPVAVTSDVVSNITSLFRNAAMETDDDNAGDVQVDNLEGIDRERLEHCILKDLQRLPRLSAPGPLAMRNEHLQLLAKSSDVGQDIGRLLADLALGRVHIEVVRFLRGGRISPLSKPDGGVRPLTLSNVLRRAALRTLVRQRKDEIGRAVGPLQYGVARKAGVDALHKSLKVRLASHPGSVLVCLDFKAAFQNISRSKVRSGVMKHAPWLLETCDAWYGGPATHVLLDQLGVRHIIQAADGVDQGCPLGALFFALALHDVSEEVLSFAKRLDEHAGLFFYLDDGYLVCNPQVVEQVLLLLRQTFAKVGVALNESKLQAWAASPASLPASLQQYYKPSVKCLGRQIDIPGQDAHDGLVVSNPQATLEKESTHLVKLTDRLLELNKNGLDLQTSDHASQLMRGSH